MKYPLFETIKIINGKISNLDSHEKRFKQSFIEYFKNSPEYELKEIIKIPEEYRNGIVKLRFLYSEKNFNTEFSYYVKKKINTLKIVYDDIIDYSLKFTDRTKLNGLLAQKGQCDDILIIKNGYVTDISFANIIFFDGEKWLTPSNPLLKGTCREKLLKEKGIFEQNIYAEDLKNFTHFAIINAMLCPKIESKPISGIHF